MPGDPSFSVVLSSRRLRRLGRAFLRRLGLPADFSSPSRPAAQKEYIKYAVKGLFTAYGIRVFLHKSSVRWELQVLTIVYYRIGPDSNKRAWALHSEPLIVGSRYANFYPLSQLLHWRALCPIIWNCDVE